jgi:preprotein translocase subunit YajC
MTSLLLTTSTGTSSSTLLVTVAYVAVIGVFFYFFLFRPQKKEKSKMKALISSIEIGDSVLTTSGFYGVIIDITDSDVIVEFGSNKNCRIPMQKTAIAQIEKANVQ